MLTALGATSARSVVLVATAGRFVLGGVDGVASPHPGLECCRCPWRHCVGVVVWQQRQVQQVDSARITRAAPELGHQAHQLLPNVKDAVMVVPDRPHDPQEIRASDRATRVTRVRRFTVSTNSQGYRGPEFPDTVSHPRILCVGDSVTFGWGVTFDESYPGATLQAARRRCDQCGCARAQARPHGQLDRSSGGCV